MKIFLLFIPLFLLLACERENRRFREVAGASTPIATTTMTGLFAGGARQPVAVDHPYLRNAWAMSEGKRLYGWMNCAGCHSPNGGGAIGPPLTDAHWIYGSAPENIFATIVEGRPNGMPSFGGRLTSPQVWQLVAYVRTLSGLQRLDVQPSRSEHMTERESEIRRREPAGGVPSQVPPGSVQP